MKRTGFLLPAMLMLLSCGKNNISGPDQLSGKWELRESSGGIAGTIKYDPGNGVILNFYDSKGYKFVIPGMPSRTGVYELHKTTQPGDLMLQIHYTAEGQPQVENDSIRVDAGKLVFLPSASCCDIPSVIYERVN